MSVPARMLFFTGHDGSLLLQPRPRAARRPVCGGPVHRVHAPDGRQPRKPSSTVTAGAARRFRRRPRTWAAMHGAAATSARPGYGHDHAGKSDVARGRKLVVQTVETFHKGGEPSIDPDPARRRCRGQEERRTGGASHDLRRRRAPTSWSRGEVTHLFQDREPGRTQGSHRGHRRRHRARAAGQSRAIRRTAAPAVSWQRPKIWASVVPRRAGRCCGSPAVSTTSWPGPAASISRRPNSGAGEQIVLSQILTLRNSVETGPRQQQRRSVGSSSIECGRFGAP